MSEEEDEFQLLITACLSVLILGTETKLDAALVQMTRLPWASLELVRLTHHCAGGGFKICVRKGILYKLSSCIYIRTCSAQLRVVPTALPHPHISFCRRGPPGARQLSQMLRTECRPALTGKR